MNRTKADLRALRARFQARRAAFQRRPDSAVRFRAAPGRCSKARRLRSPKRSRASSRPRSASWRSCSAQLAGTQKKIAQTQAGLTRVDDILRKHNAVAPIDGLVTYLPVRVGETVVPGVQNSAASTIMTIADMSIVTAEVKVDETDIVNVKLDQPAEITVDAIPEQDLHRSRDRNRQHRDSALHRSGGFHQHHLQPGSEGFQSGGRDGQSAGRDSPRPVLHGEDHHRHPQERRWRFRFRRSPPAPKAI